MWFAEWYAKNYRDYWEQRQSVNVQIPTKNVLDVKAVDQIKSHITLFHRRAWLQKKAETESKIDPNFLYQFRSDGNTFGIGVQAKHENSLINQPLSLTVALDRTSQAKLLESQETGLPVDVIGKVKFEGFPEWLCDDYDEKMQLIIQPLVPDRETHLQFQFFDQEGGILLESRFVSLKLIEPFGTKFQRWQGKASNQPITYTLEFDGINDRTQQTINYDWLTRNPVNLDWYFNTLILLQQTASVTITNLETGGVVTRCIVAEESGK